MVGSHCQNNDTKILLMAMSLPLSHAKFNVSNGRKWTKWNKNTNECLVSTLPNASIHAP